MSHRVPHHGVGLPRAGLTVGEDAGVVALEGGFQHVRAQVPEDLKRGQTTEDGDGGQRTENETENESETKTETEKVTQTETEM